MTICHYVLSEQVRTLSMTQRLGEFPFFKYSVTAWNWEWMNEATCVSPSNKYYESKFLTFIKITDKVLYFLPIPTSLDHFTQPALKTTGQHNSFVCTCCSLLDHSTFPPPPTGNYYFSFMFYLQYYFLMETFPDLHCFLILSLVSVISFHRILLPSFKGFSWYIVIDLPMRFFFCTYVIKNGLSAV